MKIFSLPAVFIFACCLMSCDHKDISGYVPSPYVQEIVSEKTMYEYSLLSSYTAPDSNGDIAVAGCLDRCISFRQILVSSDMHDNVSGCTVSDGLPDFAGEKIVSFCSSSGLIDTVSLTALGVGQYLCALDTVYHLSPYDMEGLGHKNRAKLIVFADPASYVSLKGDIDFLNLSFSSTMPVVYPLKETVRRCLSSIRKDSVAIGFLCDSIAADSNVYERILSDAASESGKIVSTCFVYSVPDDFAGKPLTPFLDAYISGENAKPLDAVIIDSYVPDMAAYDDAVFSVRSVLSPESLLYGKYIADDFFVLGVYETTADCCYHIMRDMNLFTHNIAFPYSEFFCMEPHPDSTRHTVISVPYVI